MVAKQKGKCPFCSSVISAVVDESNTFRRDKCRCPSCNEVIYVCRSPGCHDYAKGTESWDHELCPECTSKLDGAISTVSKYVLDAGKAIAVDFVKSKSTKTRNTTKTKSAKSK